MYYLEIKDCPEGVTKANKWEVESYISAGMYRSPDDINELIIVENIAKGYAPPLWSLLLNNGFGDLIKYGEPMDGNFVEVKSRIAAYEIGNKRVEYETQVDVGGACKAITWSVIGCTVFWIGVGIAVYLY